jgi:hypothetical protein
MILPIEENSNGLAMSLLSPELQSICRSVHSNFLKRHGLSTWYIGMVGNQNPVLTVTSNPPDGHEGTTKTLNLTEELTQDLSRFMDEEHAHWKQRSSSLMK